MVPYSEQPIYGDTRAAEPIHFKMLSECFRTATAVLMTWLRVYLFRSAFLVNDRP